MKHFNQKTKSTFAKGFVVALLLSFALAGCERVTEIPIIMSVSTGSLQFTPSGGDQSFEIISNTNHWTISSDASSWLSITPSSGQNDGTIQVSAASNTSISQKSAVITVNGRGIETRTITVTQEGAVPFVSASESTISLTTSAGDKTFNISSNTNWSITRNGATWFTFSPTSGSGDASIKLTTTANTTYSERTARATLSGTRAQSQDIIVTQAAKTPTRLDETWRSLFRAAMLSNPTWSNGYDFMYKGQVSNGYYTGLGASFWDEDRDFYIGRFEYGYRNGYGMYIVGDFDDRMLLNCSNCVIYVGNWVNGYKSGTGACYNLNGTRIYQGNFADDEPSGAYPGTASNEYRFDIIKSGNNYYIGETNNGIRSGYGLYLWQNGNIWYGSWSYDTGSGIGVYLYQNGSVVTGIWNE